MIIFVALPRQKLMLEEHSYEAVAYGSKVAAHLTLSVKEQSKMALIGSFLLQKRNRQGLVLVLVRVPLLLDD